MQSRSDHIATIVHGVIAKCLRLVRSMAGGSGRCVQCACFFIKDIKTKRLTFIHKGQDTGTNQYSGNSTRPAKKKATSEGRALVYRYVWRDDLSDTFDESVRVCLSVGRQSVCLVRATVLDPL